LTSQHHIDRRSFLKLSSALLTASSFPRRIASPQTADTGNVVYSAGFVPPGADCKVAFVCDHHYWPGHLENWGDGSQITTSTDRRMPDLVEVLNEERPDLSIHAGDVISAGDSFYPPPEEYSRQLAFAKRFYSGLAHPCMPLLGNHEILEPRYVGEAQLEAWSRNFGPPYRYHDLQGWRFVGINCLLANPQGRYGHGEVFGLDPAQFEWLKKTLRDASAIKLKVVICTHVPPAAWVNAADFEAVIASSGCVKAVLCGHMHRNSISFLGGVPVLVRTANVTSPFGYTMLHLYPDGRMLVIEKSQNFPFEDFISAGFLQGGQGSEKDRYLTLGGSSQRALEHLKVTGADARATIDDGHLRLTSRTERATVLIDTSQLHDARLTLTVIKAGGERIGGLALAAPDGSGGIEASLTSRYSPDGKVYLARNGSGGREILARSWFNIGDNIAYRLVLETRSGRVRASWKNMLDLEASVDPGTAGHFGFFVDRGSVFVTDLKLERLEPA
jgi:Calcineurin-like phosphoesterase